MFASVRTKTMFPLLQKELYACDGIRKGGEMNKGNIKRSTGTQKIQIPVRFLNAERKEAQEHKNFSGKLGGGGHRTIKAIFPFHYPQHYLNRICR